MNARKILGTAAMLGSAALILAGCSSESPVDPDSGSDAAASGEIDKVGLMLQDVSNPFFATMKYSVEQLGEAEGFDVNVQDGQQDLGQQNAQIDAFIQQKIDVLLINAVDSDGIGAAVQRAVDAGITVVAVDVDATNAAAVVSTDNVEAGRQSCTALADKIGGAGNIMIVDGTQVTSVQDRVAGCKEVLESDYPDITIVAQQAGKNDVANGQLVTTDMLTANKDVQGIFGINDPTARGAVLALQQAGRTGVWVTGVDGSPEAVTEMEREGSPFWATPAQDPGNMAAEAFKVAKSIREGNPPAERVMLINPTLVTQETVADYPGWVTG